MTSTRVWDAYDSYLEIIQSVGAASTAIQVVFDGPQEDLGDYEQIVIVGTRDATTGGPLMMIDQGDQIYQSLGAASRMETFVIPSCVLTMNGDGDFAAARALAKAFIDALAAQIYPSPAGTGDGKLNGALGTPAWCWLSVRTATADPAGGAHLVTQFDLNCAARI